nr:hypothetical protein [Chromobacterium sp. ASV5]
MKTNKIAMGLIAFLAAGAAFADGGATVAFTPPALDFSAITAWVGGAVAVGVLGTAVAFKGIDLGKRGIRKV